MEAVRISCDSRVARVVVYARGADVTRAVALPADLPTDAVELVLPAVTPFAQPGGIRAELRGERAVVGVRSSLIVPADAPRGDLGEAVRALERDRAQLQARQAALGDLRTVLRDARPAAAIDGRARHVDPAERLRGALAMAHLVHEQVAEADDRLAELAQALAENERALAAARLAAGQGTSHDRAGAGHPTREVVVLLAAGRGAVELLEVSYPVAPARWWPAYAARIAVAAGTARLGLDAHVAQETFEDWSDVAISLSTADLERDARLPKLASLRMGRRQPPARTGFRAAPAGAAAMWAGYDDVMAAQEAAVPAPQSTTEAFELSAFAEEASAPVPPPTPPPTAALPQAAAARAPERRKPGAAQRPASRAAAPAALLSSAAAPASASGTGQDAAAAALSPEQGWLRFDDLRLADASDPTRRGTLVQAAGARAAPAATDTGAPPPDARDPLRTRGSYDHRYDARAVVDVPSNGRPHRIELDDAEAEAALRLRCVPGEAAEVYREAAVRNPFAAPLLAGPVDVFADGELTRVTTIETVDRGGTITLGLGAEQRVRVARNVRAEEDTRGVLGSKTAIDHEVTIELSSALGHDVSVEVVDRIPVSDDRDVEVELRATDPPAERYDQADRGAPVRGGLRWIVPLPAGARQTLRFAYRITVPGKGEVVGGNRRA